MIYIILVVIFIVYLKLFWFASKYQYRVTVFSGKTGSGKTMLATSKALPLIKKGFPVFSTYFIEGANLLPYNFYDFNYPENSTLIIDEGQIGFDSRSYADLVKKGVSGKLKNKLSMHRHQKLDIWVITQQPQEIDAQIRRYCNEMYFCDKTLFKRTIFNDGKICNIVYPYFQLFQIWPDIETYENFKKRFDVNVPAKSYGCKKSFKIITKKVFQKYNTEQQDYASSKLPMINIEKHTDRNSLINTNF